MTDESDAAIIELVLGGQPDRFAAIVRRYRQALQRVAVSRLGRSDWAEDVVQETFFCAFKWLGSYNSQYSFRTWLWTILLNQCNRHYKKTSRLPQVNSWSDHGEAADLSALDSSASSGEPSPLSRLLQKERGELLEQLLAELPEPQADALRLRFYGGLKFQEIADAMGCSISTAKHRVRCGLEKMSSRITSDELAPVFEPAVPRDHPGSTGEPI